MLPSLLAPPSYLVGNVARIGHRLLLHALAEHDLRVPHAAILPALCDFGPPRRSVPILEEPVRDGPPRAINRSRSETRSARSAGISPAPTAHPRSAVSANAGGVRASNELPTTADLPYPRVAGNSRTG